LNTATITNCIFPVADFSAIKLKVLNWINRFSTFCFLDNHQYDTHPHSEECIAAAGCRSSVNVTMGNALEQLQQFIDENNGWLFGHLSYDLENKKDEFTSYNKIGFPSLFFFEPAVLVRLDKNKMTIDAPGQDPLAIYKEIENSTVSVDQSPAVVIQQRVKKQEYLAIIEKLRRHILRGDCYEINFCQEFFAEHADIDPLTVYKKLSRLSPNPFSAFYRVNDSYLICASPERFLKKKGSDILSQPVKGTSKRFPGSKEDEQSKKKLSESAKDRSENVMIVDLVRNDLSKICIDGTVKVDELYGIYAFPQVYQMISTISGQLKENISFTEIVDATFPMGSMTGAPKKRVMELIRQHEKTGRGIFSGAVGYIDPQKDFDLNVVIRSIMYNSTSNYLSFQAGSGITFYSDAEQEWEECLVKAEAMKKALE
jgi:para-aminobenzoate synthetase component 1